MEEKKEKYPTEFQELFQKSKSNDPFPIVEARVRNVLFVGKTRVGKSTVFNVLKDPTYLGGGVNIFSETKDPNLYTISVTSEKTGTVVINIIDTPGLFETHKLGNEEEFRDNEVLKKMIKKCMQCEITKIHAIFFVCSFSTGIDREQLQAFFEFSRLLKGAEDKIALLITRAENFTSQRKIKLMEEIENESNLSELLNKIGGRSNIFFTGAIPKTDVEKGYVDTVEKVAKNVFEMRRSIFNFLFESETYCEIKTLEHIGHYENEFIKLIDKFSSESTKLKVAIQKEDFMVANDLKNTLKILRKGVEENMKLLDLGKNKEKLKSFDNSLKEFKELCIKYRHHFLEQDMVYYNNKKVENNTDTKSINELATLKNSIKLMVEKLQTEKQEFEKYSNIYEEFKNLSN